MVAFRFVLSCSIAPSLLIDGVVVEKNKQLGMDDYYEANYEASYVPICPADAAWKQTLDQPEAASNQAKFAGTNFIGTEANAGIAKALKKFLFDRTTNDAIPKLFAAGKTGGLDVGDNTCSIAANWVSIKYATDPKYVCGDCGYDMTDTDGKLVIEDIVGFAKNQGHDKASTADIPQTWCHNPFPEMTKYNGLAEEKKKALRDAWRGTGGYYNVLRCNTSNYSVIGFAAEKKGTCYPFHTHKSYELYWTIGGKATWKAGKPPETLDPPTVPKFTPYTMNEAQHELHKHDPMITHEMETPTVHTTQIYFWSMSGYDNLGANGYDADAKNVVFGFDANGDQKISPSEEHQFPTKSCYNNKAYGHIGDK